MKRMAMVTVTTLSLLFSANSVAVAAPYISCPGGYIAPTGSECPPFRTPIAVHPGQRSGGGGGDGGGLLGTLGRVLGGLTGGLL